MQIVLLVCNVERILIRTASASAAAVAAGNLVLIQTHTRILYGAQWVLKSRSVLIKYRDVTRLLSSEKTTSDADELSPPPVYV